MAKKKEVLTAEEKLEKAIVPDCEQPYDVPSNWVWTILPEVCESIKAGGDKPKNTTSEKTICNQIPVIANGVLDLGIVGYTNISTADLNTITVSARGTIGYSVFREYPYYPIVRLITIKPLQNLNGKFLKYAFDNFLEEGTGSSIPQLTVPMLKNKYIPLPPVTEQKRIVERIESLFSKLDEAKELAQSALDSFENRKSAILHKAFTGELTKKWREENGVGFDSWVEKQFEDLINFMQNGLSKRNGDGLPTVVLRLVNIGIDSILKDDLRFINLTLKEKDKYLLNNNDVLMIRVNGSHENVGRQILINKTDDFAFCDHLIRINFNNQLLNNKFIIYYSYTHLYRNYIKENMVSSAGQNTISRKGLSNLKVNLPTLPEQLEIVRILDNIFEKETQAKAAANIIEQIDLMKKAILARAFRGELGTNDASDESALELLKEIIEVN